MHRYQPDTIARIRTDYVHEQQARYRTAIAELENRIASASTSERMKLNKKLTTLKAQEVVNNMNLKNMKDLDIRTVDKSSLSELRDMKMMVS